MTSYFDEHNCEELGPGQTPDHLMHFARLLIDTGAWNEVGSFDILSFEIVLDNLLVK